MKFQLGWDKLLSSITKCIPIWEKLALLGYTRTLYKCKNLNIKTTKAK
jgi:hypothetical protein